MKSKIVPLLVFLLLCALGGGGYWYWTRTPQYSMIKLKEAVHDRDESTFERYFDVNGVASNAVTDLTTEELKQVGGSILLRRFLGGAINGFFKPQMVEKFSNDIRDFVSKTPEQRAAEQAAKEQAKEAQRRNEGALGRLVDGLVTSVVDAVKPPSFREVLNEMGLTKENYKGLTSFEVNGPVCHVGMKFEPPGKAPVTVMLELDNADDHWHVVRISNMDALARILTASDTQ